MELVLGFCVFQPHSQKAKPFHPTPRELMNSRDARPKVYPLTSFDFSPLVTCEAFVVLNVE